MVANSIFDTAVEAYAFKRNLQLFAALADKGEGGVSAVGFALGSILEAHGPRREWAPDAQCPACGSVFPCVTTLIAVGHLQYPIDWSIAEATAAVSAVNLNEYGTLEVSDDRIILRHDPDFEWKRIDADTWRFAVVERGTEHDGAVLVPEADMPLHFLTKMLPGVHPYPYAWSLDERTVHDLEQLLPVSQQRWRDLRAKPFLHDWH